MTVGADFYVEVALGHLDLGYNNNLNDEDEYISFLYSEAEGLLLFEGHLFLLFHFGVDLGDEVILLLFLLLFFGSADEFIEDFRIVVIDIFVDTGF